MTETVHASCVAVRGAGVLIRGPSGAGKSSTALRLIALGAVLVADDRTILSADDSGVMASPHPAIAGRIEARGIGILTLPRLDTVRLSLIVDLDATEPERLPQYRQTCLLGHRLRVVSTSVARPAMIDAVFLLAGGAEPDTG